jgi:predicted O-methyltransferase YrrM
VTIEGDPGIAGVARTHLDRLGHRDRVDVITGRFGDVLPHVLTDPFDLVFVDGHHEEAATHAYWEMLRPTLPAGACVAFDDIEPGRPVRRAWKRIVSAEKARGAVAVDLLGLGLLFMPAAGAGAAESVSASELGALVAGQ